MINKPDLLSSEVVHEGWLQVQVDTVLVEGRKSPYKYETVRIGDGVAVLPFLDDSTVLLARQYRPPIDSLVVELIQGGEEEV